MGRRNLTTRLAHTRSRLRERLRRLAMFGEIDRELVPLVAPDDGCDKTGGVKIDFDVLSAPSQFRQSFHVRHRLGRDGAGRYLDFDTSGPKEIAAVSDGP